MKVSEILREKGCSVHTIAPTATLANVVDKLVKCNCGSLLVTDDDKTVGIITERDILRAASAKRCPMNELSVRDHMSSELITGNSDDDVGAIMGLLTKHRIRHLPIVDDGQLAGIISIGDVVKAQHDKLSLENHYLKNYIQS